MTKRKHTTILYNYGGGMRGLIPAHIMSQIEDKTGLAMTDLFDVFAGPSTGSILNAALNIPCPHDRNRPRFTAAQMVRFYEREGIRIFPPDRFRDLRALIHDFNNRTLKIDQLKTIFDHGHYNPNYLLKCLTRLYGTHKIEDTIKSIVISTYNIDGSNGRERETITDNGGYAVWLKNMKVVPEKRYATDVKLVDAVAASTAAPSFFPCHNFTADKKNYNGVDGSLFDNPCVSYHGAIRLHLPTNSDVTVVMLGTGNVLRSFSQKEWNSYGGLGIVDPVNDTPLINIMLHASETALTEAFDEYIDGNGYVFNKSLIGLKNGPDLELDNAEAENLKRMRNFAFELMEENADKLDEVCHKLVKHYEKEQQNQRPKRKLFSFFKGDN